MKKVTLIVLVMALALSTAGIAMGQGFGLVWDDGITVANMSRTSAATYSIDFYPMDGSAVIHYAPTAQIPLNGSVKLFPLDQEGLGASFIGSAIVSADQEVAATVNQLTKIGTASAGGGSYEGLSAGANEVRLPIIMRGNGGYNTAFTIQNAGSSPATINVSYKAGVAGSDATDGPYTLQPGYAKVFDQSTFSALGTRFVGSAIVSSNVAIVGAVNQVNPTAKVILSYRGFASGSQSVNLPTIQANNGGFNTGIAVQNMGTAPTNITVTFGPNTVGSFAPTAETVNNVAAGSSVNFNQWGGQWGTNRYVGSAVVSNSAGQNLVVNVNQLKTVAPGQGSAYSGFDPSTATTEIVIPTLMAFNGGFVTGFLVQNVGSSTATFTATFTTSAGAYTSPEVEVASGIAGGAGFNFRQYAGQWTDATKNNSQRWVGSAIVRCSQPCVAVVNQLIMTGATADSLLTYTGTNR